MSELKGEAKKTFNASSKAPEMSELEKFRIQREAQQAVASRGSTTSPIAGYVRTHGMR